MIISGPERGRQGHDHRRAQACAPHDPDYHYVVTCTTRAPRPGEVDGVDYHFLDPRDVRWRCATPASSSRPTRSTATGTGRRAAGPRGARRRAGTSSSRSTSRAPRSSRSGSRRRSSSSSSRRRSRTCSSGCAAARDRDRRRARTPPAERRHRARPPGGLRLRRDQRDRPGRADGRADRRRSSPTSTAGTPTGGSRSTRRSP